MPFKHIHRIHWAFAFLCLAMMSLMAHAQVPVTIPYTLNDPGQVSIAVYDQQGTMVRTLLSGEQQDAGSHQVQWDGLDRYGKPMPVGSYDWRLLVTPGLQAEYIGMLGTNAVPNSYDYWYGNHSGPTSVVTDGQWVYLGGSGENVPSSLSVSLIGDTQQWTADQRFVAGRATSLALGQGMLYELTTHGNDASVSIIDPATGIAQSDFDVRWDPNTPEETNEYQMTVASSYVVVSYPARNTLRWYNINSGTNPPSSTDVTVTQPIDLAGMSNGTVYVISQDQVVSVLVGGTTQTIIPATSLQSPWRIATVPTNSQLLVAERDGSHVVKRFDIATAQLLQTYGQPGGRLGGTFVKTDFHNINDVVDDGQGGIIIQEGGDDALRRTVRINAQGQHVRTWYGALKFFNYASPDPDDPTKLFYWSDFSPKTLANFNLTTGQWDVLENYEHTNYDGLFPTPGKYNVRWQTKRRGGSIFLAGNSGQHWGIVRVDQTAGQLVPVATAGIWYKYRTDPMPAVLEQAVIANGLTPGNLSLDVLFAWSDRNSDGLITADEVRIDTNSNNWIFNNWQMSLDEDWNVYLSTPSGYLIMPNDNSNLLSNIPFWDPTQITQVIGWDIAAADRPEGWKSRGMFRDTDGSIYQSYEGQSSPQYDRPAEGWPTLTAGASRLVKRHADGSLAWVVGKHAVQNPNTSIYEPQPVAAFHDLYDIMGKVTLGGQNDCIVFGDRVVRPAVAYTQDGLYAGSFFDRRTNDGLPGRLYCWWRDPVTLEDAVVPYDVLTIGTIAQINNNEVIWYAMGNHNTPVYRITGWQNWTRQSGSIALSQTPPSAPGDGVGLHAEYFDNYDLQGTSVAQQTDQQLWYSVRNDKAASGNWDYDYVVAGLERDQPFGVRWTGTLVAPLSEPFTFSIINESQIGTTKGERWDDIHGGVRIWLNGRRILERWYPDAATNPPVARRPDSDPLMLQAGARYQITVEYGFWGANPAEFSLIWESPTLERQRIPMSLYKPTNPTDLPQITMVTTGGPLHENLQDTATCYATIPSPLAYDLTLDMQLLGVDPGDIQGFIPQLVIPAGQTQSQSMTLQAVDNQQLNGERIIQITPVLDGQWTAMLDESIVSIELIDDEAITSDGLVLHWNFDEINGLDVPDVSGEGQNGIINGPVTTLSDDAVHGKSLVLNGIQNYVKQSIITNDLANSPYTASLWFKTLGSSAGLIRLEASSYSRSLFTEDYLLWSSGLGQYAFSNTQANVSVDQWHHLVEVVDTNRLQIYLDGQCVLDSQGTVTMAAPASKFLVGYVSAMGAKRKLEGKVDEFRVYNRILDTNEIQLIYDAGMQSLSQE